MEKIIQIGIPCSKNCEDYVSFLLESIIKTVSKESLKGIEIILAVDDKVNNKKIDKIIKDITLQGLEV